MSISELTLCSFSLQLVCHLLIALEACVVRGFSNLPSSCRQRCGHAGSTTERIPWWQVHVCPSSTQNSAQNKCSKMKETMNEWVNSGRWEKGENRQSHSPVWVGGERDAEHRWRVHRGSVSSMWTELWLRFCKCRLRSTWMLAHRCVPGLPEDTLNPTLWLGSGILMSSPGDWGVPLWGSLTQEPRRG